MYWKPKRLVSSRRIKSGYGSVITSKICSKAFNRYRRQARVWRLISQRLAAQQRLQQVSDFSQLRGKIVQILTNFLNFIDKVEENSGVDFPGDCLEPFIGSSLIFDDLNLLESVIIVELASPKFAYKYENQGQV